MWQFAYIEAKRRLQAVSSNIKFMTIVVPTADVETLGDASGVWDSSGDVVGKEA